ncbi:hypothetical protein EJ08DRAFT_654113 [Tothia fuscella]|uniref:Ethanolamine utilization protein n=1 Tax=Tothia fuscella TaxID=1048955 RepID=A0A9P4TT31_9PEZI|nr:hypothetical protein EJ08DRAFT_654113 [Tothia fuscella]
MAEKVAFQYYAKASTDFASKLPLIGNENAFLGDISNSTDSAKPLSAGFFNLKPGTPLVYDYTYHEMKIIISGSFDIEDETGKKVHAVAGDVFYFPKGSKITFTTTDGGLAFYTGQRGAGEA